MDLGFWILQVVSSADFACEARYSEVLAGFTIQIALAQGGEKYSGHRDTGRQEASGCVMAGMVEMHAGNFRTSSTRVCGLRFACFSRVSFGFFSVETILLLRVLLSVGLCVGSCVLFFGVGFFTWSW